jgi:uncharacterized membrane protein YkoI
VLLVSEQSLRIWFSDLYNPEEFIMITRRVALLAFAFSVAAAASAGAQKTEKAAKHETQAALEKEAKFSMKDARALAEKTVPGAKIESGELEREGGKLIYSFDMKTAGKSGIDEVNIDAMSGKLISNKHETPAQEKAEAAADAKAAKHAKKGKP